MPKLPHNERLLKAIGLTALYWSALEEQMEFAILRFQRIPPSSGLPITSNVGFKGKWDLLDLAAKDGTALPSAEAIRLRKILTRILNAYPKRNRAVHAIWIPTKDPAVVLKAGIRTKGKLIAAHDRIEIAQVEADAEEIRQIGEDLSAFLKDNHLSPKRFRNHS